MLNEEKLRAKLMKILTTPHIHSFAVKPLINDIVNAVKACEKVPEQPKKSRRKPK